jgi:hypothetical protein
LTDEPAKVVPIAPGVRVIQPRSVALLEMVCQSLAAFEDIEEPSSIAFLIYGQDGQTKVGWDVDGAIGEKALLALAAVHLAAKSVDPD